MTWTASGRQNGQTAAGMGFLVQILESRRNIVNSLGISMLRQLKSGQAARAFRALLLPNTGNNEHLHAAAEALTEGSI